MPTESIPAITRIVDQGVLGTLLILSILLFWYMTKRFLDHLETLTKTQESERKIILDLHIAERDKWLSELTRHSDASKELYRTNIEHDRWERDQNRVLLESIQEITIWIKSHNGRS